MTASLAALMVVGGLIALTFGGEVLLRGSVGLAKSLGLSPLLIGLSVVAAGTSMPELIVSVNAGLQGAADIAVGNIVGSNIANILLILGAGALIAPIPVLPAAVMKDTIVMLGATLLFIAFALSGTLERWQGLVMPGALIAFLVWSYHHHAQGPGTENSKGEDTETAPQSPLLASLFVVAGLGALILGADVLIDGALFIARAFGVSEVVIGLTLVALGTSLPELATVMVAAFRGQPDVALGGVLGSNIFNILLILGLVVLVSPFAVAPDVIAFDMWVMLGSSLFILPAMLYRKKICRPGGALLLLLYVLYISKAFDLLPF